MFSSGVDNEDVNIITKSVLKDRLENDVDIFVIDVREPHEVLQTGEIGVNIPLGDIASGALGLSPEDFEYEYGVKKPETSFDVAFVCKAGVRSCFAAKIARDAHGYSRVLNYSGGADEWFRLG